MLSKKFLRKVYIILTINIYLSGILSFMICPILALLYLLTLNVDHMIVSVFMAFIFAIIMGLNLKLGNDYADYLIENKELIKED